MNETKFYLISDSESFSMAFAYITKENRVIIIDGGFPVCMPYVKRCVGGREIAAWIFTHPHIDHISGFIEEIEKGNYLNQVRKIYYNFPSADFVKRSEPNEPQTILDFERIFPLIQDRTVKINKGMKVDVDELTIDFMFVGGERFFTPKPNLAVNESSCAFKITSSDLRSVLFLGDLGPEGGRALMDECGYKLKSDIVQMSHHGHSGVSKDVYAKISPAAALWCAPEWLWNEEPVEFEPELWGTVKTRQWMEELGITENYIAKDGTQIIPLHKK